jgi:chromate reductase, NAD(P)H dehydrogenase (quinone)
MITILGLSGSLRQGSYNTALLHAGARLMPAGITLVVKTIHGIPLYNEDDENTGGIPPVVQTLKEEIAAAAGLLLSTPEYNNSIPGPFKNAIDWVSRPGGDIPRVFGGKPIALIGCSPGSFGSAFGQNAWLPLLRTFGTKPWFGGRMAIPQAHKLFGPTGELINDEVRRDLKSFLTGFAQFIEGPTE